MRGRSACILAVLTGFVSCVPALTPDGQLLSAPEAQRGGTILTAQRVEFVDRNCVPKPVVHKSAFQPWSPATGFPLPEDGLATHLRATGVRTEMRQQGEMPESLLDALDG